MKSSCCGAEIKRISSHVFDDMDICAKCKECCNSIPDDIMSKKEVLEFCEKWGDGVLNFYNDIESGYIVVKHIIGSNNIASDVYCFLEQVDKLLKSIKEHLK